MILSMLSKKLNPNLVLKYLFVESLHQMVIKRKKIFYLPTLHWLAFELPLPAVVKIGFGQKEHSKFPLSFLYCPLAQASHEVSLLL